MFPVLFAIPRTSGRLARRPEVLDNGDQRISWPGQIYTGPTSGTMPMAVLKRNYWTGISTPSLQICFKLSSQVACFCRRERTGDAMK